MSLIEQEIEYYLSPGRESVETGAYEIATLALNFSTNGDHDSAVEHYEKAIGLCHENGLRPMLCNFKIQAAKSLINLNRLEDASAYLEQADTEVRAMENIRLMIDCSHTLAICCRKKNEPEKAVEFYRNCISIILEN